MARCRMPAEPSISFRLRPMPQQRFPCPVVKHQSDRGATLLPYADSPALGREFSQLLGGRSYHETPVVGAVHRQSRRRVRLTATPNPARHIEKLPQAIEPANQADWVRHTLLSMQAEPPRVPSAVQHDCLNAVWGSSVTRIYAPLLNVEIRIDFLGLPGRLAG